VQAAVSHDKELNNVKCNQKWWGKTIDLSAKNLKRTAMPTFSTWDVSCTIYAPATPLIVWSLTFVSTSNLLRFVPGLCRFALMQVAAEKLFTN
jgi:hypothetical protein